MPRHTAGGEAGHFTLNNRVVGKVHFSGMIGSLSKEIVGTTRKRLSRRNKHPPKGYHPLAEIARAPAALEQFSIAPFHRIVEYLRCDSGASFDAKVTGGGRGQTFNQ